MMEISITKRQKAFIEATADEVLFGGAAGGGKSYGQVVDALVFALRYDGSRQLVLRRTMPELERTLIRTAQALYPGALCSYHAARRTMCFINGSCVEFGYCGTDRDVYRYQSAEYDVVRFDELTHFTEHMYTYLMSRVRGVNGYPKQLKSTTNPGNIGHDWVKKRFIDPGPPDIEHAAPTGSRVFLPALVADNVFLKKFDPDYPKRLAALGDAERRALVDGDWNIAAGRYFDEWDSAVHVVRPFEIPRHWRVYFSMDYGLDMLAGYWIAVDEDDCAVVFRELWQPGFIISAAAEKILAMTQEPVEAFFAPPDLWNRRQETGISAADIFLEHGIALTKAPAGRVSGWLELKEWLKPRCQETGNRTANIVFFDTCTQAIRCLPAIAHSRENPSDCSSIPHELTHAPDAIRYFVASRPSGAVKTESSDIPDSLQALLRYRGFDGAN